MKLNKTLIVLLAVLMLILSAGAVSAEDGVNDDAAADDGAATDDAVDGAADDAAGEETDGAADEDAGDEADDATDDGQEYVGDIGDPIATGSNDAESATDDVAETSSSDLSKNPAGNPILVLLVAIAGFGIASIKRK